MARNCKPFTKEEIAFLRVHSKNMDVQELAIALERTHKNIINKCRDMGLKPNKKPTRWTPEKIKFLKLNAGKMSTQNIAKTLDFSYWRVQYKCKALILPWD